MLLGCMAMAQNKAVDALFEKYGNNDNFTVVNIGGKMMSAIGGNEDGQDIDGLLDSINGVRVLTLEEGSDQLKKQFSNDLKSLFKENKYERILHVRDGDETVAIYSVDGAKGMNELGIVVTEPGESVLVYISGQNINLGALGDLADVDGLADMAGQF